MFTTISPDGHNKDEEGHLVQTEENYSHLWRKYRKRNKYQKLLEPPTKQKKASKGKRIDVICGQCNKPRHSKECCHWNLNNPNNKLKDKKEVVVNGVLAQPSDIGNKYGKK